jgi:hypothetical protein
MVTYGDWTRIEGELDDIEPEVIEQTKKEMYVVAEGALKSVGVDIAEQTLEWVIRQSYSDGEMIDDKPFDGAKPYVTVGWKTAVNNNGR